MKLCQICDSPTNGYKYFTYSAFCSIECFRKYNNEKTCNYYKSKKGKSYQLAYEKNRNTKQCKFNDKKYRKHWSDEDIAKLLKLRKDGLTYAQLVCEFSGRTIWSVKGILGRLNKHSTPKHS